MSALKSIFNWWFKTLRIALTALMVTVGMTTTALAVWDVSDSAVLAKLSEMFNQARQQLDTMLAVKDTAEETANAVGEAASIVVPILDLQRFMSSGDQLAQCLIPDLSGIFPTMETKELKFDSLCEAKDSYRSILSVSREELNALSPRESLERLQTIRDRRINQVEDSILNGLGLGDTSRESAERINGSVRTLEGTVRSAKSTQERLNAIALQNQVQLQALSELIQIQAQMLKLQSARYYLDIQGDNRPAEEEE